MTASLDEGWALDEAQVDDIDEALAEPDLGATESVAAESVVPEEASAESVDPEEASAEAETSPSDDAPAEAETSPSDDAPEVPATLGRVDYEFRSKMAAAAARAPEPPSSRLAAGLAIGLVIGLCIGWFGGRTLASRATHAASNTTAPIDSVAASHDEPGAIGSEAPRVDQQASQAIAAEAAALEAASLEAAAPEAAALEAAVLEAVPLEAVPPSTDLAGEVAITPEALPTELAPEAPEGAVFPISAPRDGVVTKIFAKTGQRVWKGERLFEISQPKSDILDSNSLKEKIAELEAQVGSKPLLEVELTEARRKLDLLKAGYRGGRRAIAYASEGGFADHQLSIGDTVTMGQVLVRVIERSK